MFESLTKELEILKNDLNQHCDLNLSTNNQLPFLYHYTNWDSIVGILVSGEVWLTDSNYTNDPIEVIFSLERIAVQLKFWATKHNFFKYFQDIISSIPKKYELFIFSMSELENDLSQWRAYGDDGAGFSIGFHKDVFRTTSIANYDGSEPILGKVIYDELSLDRLCNLILKNVYDFLLMIEGRGGDNAALLNNVIGHRFLAEILSEVFLRVAALFKNWAYRNEKEWRLIYCWPIDAPPKNQTIKWRDQNKNKGKRFLSGSKYVPLHYQKPSMKRVIIGPCLHIEFAKQELNNIINGMSFRDAIDISFSGIPYRNNKS